MHISVKLPQSAHTADVTSGKEAARLSDELATAKAQIADLKERMLNVGDGMPTTTARDLVNAVGRRQLDATTALGCIPAGELRDAAESALGGLTAYQSILPLLEGKAKSLEAKLELAKLGEAHPQIFRAVTAAIDLAQRLGTTVTVE